MNAAPQTAPVVKTELSAEIVSTRLLAASLTQVYSAFSDPQQLALWWGPAGFSNVFETFDLREGGEWRFTMHGPDGAEYPCFKTFTTVRPLEAIVHHHHSPTHGFDMVMTFAEEANGVRLTWRMRFESDEEGVKVRDFIIGANQQNFDRLEAHLADIPGSQDVVMSRHLEADRDAVFRAWTEDSMLSQWWGPHAFTNPVCQLGTEAGDLYRVVMRSPEGEDYPLTGRLLEKNAPWHLAMTMDCTEHPPAWHDVVKPERAADDLNPAGVMLMTVAFVEEDGGTRLLIRIRFQSAELRDAFLGMGIHDGWGESLDSLAALLLPRD